MIEFNTVSVRNDLIGDIALVFHHAGLSIEDWSAQSTAAGVVGIVVRNLGVCDVWFHLVSVCLELRTCGFPA